jgi:hypothetical protein
MKAVNLFKASFVLAAMICSANVCAGEASVTWGDTDKFYDVEQTNGNSANFIKSLKKSFNAEFDNLALRLPDGYVFNVQVNNLDLAGKVDVVALSQGRKFRAVTDLYFPMINLNYKVKNKEGAVVLEQSGVVIKDPNYLNSTMKIASSKSNYYYEFAMMQKWFAVNILTKVP